MNCFSTYNKKEWFLNTIKKVWFLFLDNYIKRQITNAFIHSLIPFVGLCMVYFEKKNILNHYNCGNFKEGCPNTWYRSDEMFKCMYLLYLYFTFNNVLLSKLQLTWYSDNYFQRRWKLNPLNSNTVSNQR